MVPIGFVFVNCSLKHGFEDFVNNLDLAIPLWIVGIIILVLETQHGCKLIPDLIFKVSSMVRDQFLWDTKLGNHMVKE
jgi:hypothetical protein